jgi:hypothetical protein
MDLDEWEQRPRGLCVESRVRPKARYGLPGGESRPWQALPGSPKRRKRRLQGSAYWGVGHFRCMGSSKSPGVFAPSCRPPVEVAATVHPTKKPSKPKKTVGGHRVIVRGRMSGDLRTRCPGKFVRENDAFWQWLGALDFGWRRRRCGRTGSLGGDGGCPSAATGARMTVPAGGESREPVSAWMPKNRPGRC